MDEITNQFSQAPSLPESGKDRESPSSPTRESTDSPATERFKSCRWRCAPDEGAFCTHRDVLPFAGKEGFTADSWCPDCGFYKLRRTPKKRERLDFTY